MSQFGTLFKKNFIVWRRDLCCCICQLLTAFIFALILVAIKGLSNSSKVTTDSKSYLDSQKGGDLVYPMPSFDMTSPMTDAAIVSSYANYANFQVRGAKQGFKNCNIQDVEDPKKKGGYIALVTTNDWMHSNLVSFFDQLNFTTKRFSSVDQFTNLITDDKYGTTNMANGIPDTVCMGISFQEDSGLNWQYSLHFNSSGRPADVDIEDSVNIQEEPFKEELSNGQFRRYLSSGALVLQGLIDNLILRNASNSNQAHIQSRFVQLPVEKYSDSGLYTNTNNGQIDTYIIYPLLVIFLGFIYHMLKEKEKKITENMRNMGMSLLPHYLSWYTFYLCVLFTASIIWALIVKATFFRYSNFILIWFLFFLPGIVLLSLAFIVCSFFVTSKPGVLTGIITFFLLYAVTIGKGSVDVPSENSYNAFALSPFTGLQMAGANMVLLESLNDFGFGFENISQPINFFKYGTFIAICIVEAILFFLLGIYLDQVWPTEIGIKKHPLFCIGIGSKKDKDSGNSAEEDASYAALNYEQIPAELRNIKPEDQISIKNLRKVYGTGKVAVHNLSLDMFNNQIFALLGHNGAGKTTTISMISGLLTQTSGSINICGYDTKTQYDQVKSILGVCPQLNPIYDDLTCEEHLRLYGNLKLNGKGKLSEAEIDQVLNDIDLLDKKSYKAGKLSGGQKRKLCIGIAFIGGSKVILLDEPTSGMDTYARRFLWEMIKKYKKDRIIILCTHYMDEADFLGDRFGIMGEGRLITCGSSLFLKKRFGVGYDLTVVKESIDTSTDKITELVKSKVPSAEFLANISMEIKFRLPNDQSALFEALFKEMEDCKEKYGIQSFGISLTTLEEVFLKVAVGISHDKEDKNSHSKPSQSNTDKHQSKEASHKQKAAEYDDDDNFDLDSIRIKGGFAIFSMHFMALVKKRLIYFKRDYKGVFCEIVLPIIIISIGLLFTLITFVKDPVAKMYTPGDYYAKTVNVWANTKDTPAASEANFNAILDKMTGIPKWKIEKTVQADNLTEFDKLLLSQRDPNRYIAYDMEKINTAQKSYSYVMFYNTTVQTSLIIGVNQMNNAILKQATGDDKASIKVKFAGLKLTKQISSFNNVAIGFIAVFIYALAYAFIPAGVVLFIVKERENNSKHQQIVSGVSIYAYWFSNLLIDIVKYFIPGIYCALSVLIFDINAFKERDGLYGMVWALVITYGPSIMAFTYLTSFMFKSPESAQVATFMFNFLAGFILMLLSFVLRIISSTRNTAIWFPELFLRLFPTYDFSWGLFQLSNSVVWKALYKLDEVPGPWSRYGAMIDFIYMVTIPIVCMAIIFFIELKGDSVRFSTTAHGQKLVDLQAGDDDVKAEREEVINSEDYAIKVVDYVKEFKMVSKKGGACSGKLVSSKVAVKGVTFGVKKGECFGLLGTNGAGKTTTFKALCGEVIPTFGMTKIAGYDLSKDMNRVRYLIGYCPQFDALLDNLTAREHLELYAAIKGIPVELREKLIQAKLHQLNLKQFEDVLAGTYSGGNKRKLSVAIALLGNPPIILLDEPSSGMDPEARRFMWSVVGRISSEKKYSSVVLTTHSMEEAEALSTKLAIMVEGSIECIGPVQKLKNKYGKGFEIEVKIEVPDKDEIAEKRRQLNLANEEDLTAQDVFALLERLNLNDMRSEVKEGGKCEVIHNNVIYHLHSLNHQKKYPRSYSLSRSWFRSESRHSKHSCNNTSDHTS